MISKFLSRNRARSVERRLADDPSVDNYVDLARAHATAGRLEEARRISREGLEVHPGNAELERIHQRACALLREDRIRTLQKELRTAPRPALWRELCELFRESGRIRRMEEAAQQWHAATGDGEALLMRATARAERFFADRRREDGKLAFEWADAAAAALGRDERPMRLLLELASRAGAWQDARRTLARLLELHPGDPALEARFRTVLALAEKGPTRERALLEVERTGRLVDEEPSREPAAAPGDVRPRLSELVREEDVRAAFYVRGGTALVQGPRGATAERTARAVREIAAATRAAARRLGLGRATDLRVEGAFGTLVARMDEIGAAAAWCTGTPGRRTLTALSEIAGAAGREERA